jgi:excisionase family DNA binding protein
MAKHTNPIALAADILHCSDGLMRPYPEAAAFLGIGRSKMFELMSKGTVPTVRVSDGGPRRIPKAALVRYLDARVVARDR